MAKLWLEWVVLFLGFPLLAFCGLIPTHPLLILSIPFFYAIVAALFLKRRLLIAESRSAMRGFPPQLSWRMPVVVGAIFGYAFWVHPETFLSAPATQSLPWLALLLVYPLISVLPQEFLYRRFYFWRYQKVFGSQRWVAISSVLTFSFLHIAYSNMVAITLTLLGGTLFTVTYLHTKRLMLCWVEHAVYGVAIFVSGLGQFFTLLHF